MNNIVKGLTVITGICLVIGFTALDLWITWKVLDWIFS